MHSVKRNGSFFNDLRVRLYIPFSRQKALESRFSKCCVKVKEIEINYFRSKKTKRNKPPIVILHGLTDSALCWLRVAHVLQSKYDVIVLDQRGHGLSTQPKTGYSDHDFAYDLKNFLAILGIDSPILIGHSIGANIAILFASQAPKVCKAIVLVDPPWEEKSKSRLEHEADFIEIQNSITEAHSMGKAYLMSSCLSAFPQISLLDCENWAISQQRASVNVASWALSSPMDWKSNLTKFKSPVLLVTGNPKRGAIVTKIIAKIAYRTHSNLKVLYIGKAGHSIHQDQFRKFTKTIIKFLGNIK